MLLETVGRGVGAVRCCLVMGFVPLLWWYELTLYSVMCKVCVICSLLAGASCQSDNGNA